MQVTRNYRRDERARSRLLGLPGGRRVRVATAVAGSVALVALGSGVGLASTQEFGTDQVGQTTDKGEVVSSDQYLKSIGSHLVVNDGKIMASSVSPDGSHLAALTTDGDSALTIVDLKSWKVQQLVGNKAADNLKITGSDVGQ